MTLAFSPLLNPCKRASNRRQKSKVTIFTSAGWKPLCPILNVILNNVTVYSQYSTAVIHCLLIATHFTDPRKDDSLCQARECHWELNPGRWRQRRVCYHTATCSLRQRSTTSPKTTTIYARWVWKRVNVQCQCKRTLDSDSPSLETINTQYFKSLKSTYGLLSRAERVETGDISVSDVSLCSGLYS